MLKESYIMTKLIFMFYLGHNLIREVFESHRGGLRLDGLVVKSLLYMCVCMHTLMPNS